MATKKTTGRKMTSTLAKSQGESKPAARAKATASTAARNAPPRKTKTAATTTAKMSTIKEPAPTKAPARSSALTPANILSRAEADLTQLLESLNAQMTTAMHAFTELAVSHRGHHEAVIRTKPIDRATAAFQRIITEVLDERLSEFLPTLVALRSEMNLRAKTAAEAADSDGHAGFFARGTEMLDQVLHQAEVNPFEPRVGEPFDPLIHLAVGEVSREDLAGGAVAEVLQVGYRTARGKVIVAARVKVNRR